MSAPPGDEPYFAYGSNLDAVDRRQWCAEQKVQVEDLLPSPVGPAWLPDHDLSFRYLSNRRQAGALTLEARPVQVVQGALFRPSAAQWDLLDRKEGSTTYERIPVVVLDDRGGWQRAWTYRVYPKHLNAHAIPPSPAYRDAVHRGLTLLGHRVDVVDAAAEGRAGPYVVQKLFVYGTLMTGQPLHHHLENPAAGRSVSASTIGELYDLGAYPGMRAGAGADRVNGELVDLKDPGSLLRTLDEVESFRGFAEHASFYHRVLIRARTDDGAAHLAWTYALPLVPSHAHRVESGDWRRRAG